MIFFIICNFLTNNCLNLPNKLIKARIIYKFPKMRRYFTSIKHAHVAAFYQKIINEENKNFQVNSIPIKG